MKKNGVGMTILFLVCFSSLSLWPKASPSFPRGLFVQTRESQEQNCQNCKKMTAPKVELKITNSQSGQNKAMSEAALEMQHRRDAVSRACANLPPSAIYRNMNHGMVSRRHKFLYCPVEKSASTFWRRFMYQLVLTKPMQSPFDVSVQTVYSWRFPAAMVQITEAGEALDALLRSSTKMLFIREPYSRLLSAFVDKLLAPNPILWKMWGQPALEMCRDPKSQKWCKDRSSATSLNQPIRKRAELSAHARLRQRVQFSCGEDVTFPEFVKFVTASLASFNAHVMPIYKMCSPCYVNYTVVGHMETFARDVKLLLPKINVTEDQVSLEKMDDNVAYDAIEDSVHDAMSPAWLQHSLQCITKLDVVKRIWRKLQIRGFVSWRLKPSHFNIDRNTAENTDGPALISILVEANLKSTNKTELKLQKKQALKEAFSLLQPEQFNDIWEIFGPDFQLFGFEKVPKEFDTASKAHFINTGSLDLTKDWNMEKVL
ncbi:carbohydrate sulfotransferase [Plakobranchus ocellatus]|uniref:Carbohydrate sulfotransferase n=1 Tax=Plakobranchus ocellatus TaxID=259542 RepID=A0AAV3Z9I9_9GAST|nr:carbohydrate sulfotransferase [Plakobranchus ocellatus]